MCGTDPANACLRARPWVRAKVASLPFGSGPPRIKSLRAAEAFIRPGPEGRKEIAQSRQGWVTRRHQGYPINIVWFGGPKDRHTESPNGAAPSGASAT